MNRQRLCRASILILASALAGAGPAFSQAAADRGAREGRPQQGQERLIKTFLDHATAELNLDVEQRDGLEQVLRETMDRRGELARSQAQLRRAIREALSDPATADEDFQRLAGSILDVRREEIELLDWQEGRLLEVLTPRQTLRFMLIQQQLAQRIDDVRKNRNR